MAFAVEKVNCLEVPGAYKHWTKILKDSDNNGSFGTLVNWMNESSPPFVLKESNLRSIKRFTSSCASSARPSWLALARAIRGFSGR